MLQYVVLILSAILTAGCQTSRVEPDTILIGQERYPTEHGREVWVKGNGLVEAGEPEINQAKSTEVPLVNQRATSPDGKIRVTFHMGSRRGHGNEQTTTSYYELIDTQNARALARVESTLSSQSNGEQPYKQGVWFSLDGRDALIYETWCDGSGYHDVVALLCSSPNQSSWTLKYLDLPMFEGFPGVAEHGPVPTGFSGKFLVFNPLVSSRFYKILLAEAKTKRPPLPFSIG